MHSPETRRMSRHSAPRRIGLSALSLALICGGAVQAAAAEADASTNGRAGSQADALLRAAPATTAGARSGAKASARARAGARDIDGGAPLATPQQIESAVDRLRDDPNLPHDETVRTLHLRHNHKAYPSLGQSRPSPPRPSPPAETAGLFANMSRLVLWGMGALAIALLMVGARRWARVRAGVKSTQAAPFPTHVGPLDIRPESFPPRIGEAAAALWHGGQPRDALALLYRGAVSHAVRLHAVPIRGANTEGEALALAEGRLTSAAQALFGRLVAAWQLAAYGGRLPELGTAMALCADFDRYLAPMPATPMIRP